MTEEEKFGAIISPFIGVALKSVEMYFCTTILSFNKNLLDELCSDI